MATGDPSPTEQQGAGPILDRRQFLQAAGIGIAGAGILPLASRTSPRVGGPAHAAIAQGDDPIGDLAASLEYDPELIFRHVSDEIRYEPYAGILRGSGGTLDAHAGNSADKTLLLAALLDASLVAYRFVTGPLDDARASALLGSLSVGVATARDDAVEVLITDAQAGAPAPSAPAVDGADAFVAAAQADAANISAVAGRQLQEGVDVIVSALAGAGITIPDAPLALPDLERTSHVWLQMASGADWIDLDASMAGTQAGDRLTEPGEPLEVLPDELRHRVDFVVTTERVAGGQPLSEAIVEQAYFADQLRDVPVVFANMKPDGLDGLGIAIGGILGGGIQYNSLLAVGGTTFVATQPVRFGSGGVDIFGDPVDPSAGPGEGETIAEWLEVRVTPPGGQPYIERRTIFDRANPAARASGSIDLTSIVRVELVDLDEASPDEFLPCSTVVAFSVVGGTVNGRSIVTASQSGDDAGVMASIARAYHYLRDGLTSEVGLDQGVRTYPDAPNVASWTLRRSLTPSGEVSASLAVDIWHRSFGHLPLLDRTAAMPTAVAAGVLSHVAERIAMREGFGVAVPEGASPIVSVGAIFEAAAVAGVPTQVLQGALPTDHPYGVVAGGRMSAALASGAAVVVPAAPVELSGVPRVGWWEVDPVSGRTIDRLEDGSGATAAEYLIRMHRVITSGSCWLALSEKILGALAVTAGLFGQRGLAGGLALVAISFWFANFFNPGWGSACRAAAAAVPPVAP